MPKTKTKSPPLTICKNVDDLTFMLPIRTVTEGNAKEHWRVRHARAQKQRRETQLRVLLLPHWPPLPVTITFTRLSPNRMDCDNLPGSLKHIRDEIAAMYGVGDSDRDPIVWKYEQDKCKRGEFGVIVKAERAALAGTEAK